MAVNWMGSGAAQLLGYTVVTWFGYAGWGVNKYFIEMAGQFNFTQAFFANLQILQYELQTQFPVFKDLSFKEAKSLGFKHNKELLGLLHDKSVVAFYGDPAIDARNIKDTNYILPYTTSFKPLSANYWQITIQTNCQGSWSSETADDHDVIPGRPPFYFINQSFQQPKIIEGDIVFGKFFFFLPLKGKFNQNTIYNATFKDSLSNLQLV
eukprot:TRINITY_DN4129_c0_g2_i3.p1 TRINITY_DN4129_c0_g2~~TRINITY_DN4129_c0_g2_i3.p1  ORF type:complete len:209 (+),score=31.42 TRINITY_DN4129_c0_g2_i3:346-972(+)